MKGGCWWAPGSVAILWALCGEESQGYSGIELPQSEHTCQTAETNGFTGAQLVGNTIILARYSVAWTRLVTTEIVISGHITTYISGEHRVRQNLRMD